MKISVNIAGDEVRQNGGTVIIPVDVECDGDEFRTTVTRNANLIVGLKEKYPKEWVAHLQQICLSEITRVMRRRKREDALNIDDKMKLFEQPESTADIE